MRLRWCDLAGDEGLNNVKTENAAHLIPVSFCVHHFCIRSFNGVAINCFREKSLFRFLRIRDVSHTCIQGGLFAIDHIIDPFIQPIPDSNYFCDCHLSTFSPVPISLSATVPHIPFPLL